MYITYNNSTIATVQQITMHKAVLKTLIKPGVRRSLYQRRKPTMSTQTERQGTMTGTGDCRTLTRRNRDRTMPALGELRCPKALLCIGHHQLPPAVPELPHDAHFWVRNLRVQPWAPTCHQRVWTKEWSPDWHGSNRLHPLRKGVSNEIQDFRILAVSKEIHFLKRHLLMHD